MIIWTPAVLSVLYACVLYFCLCTCSAQLSTFHMERRSRNMLITIIIITTVTIILSITSNRHWWLSLVYITVTFTGLHHCDFHWFTSLWLSLVYITVTFTGLHHCDFHWFTSLWLYWLTSLWFYWFTSLWLYLVYITDFTGLHRWLYRLMLLWLYCFTSLWLYLVYITVTLLGLHHWLYWLTSLTLLAYITDFTGLHHCDSTWFTSLWLYWLISLWLLQAHITMNLLLHISLPIAFHVIVLVCYTEVCFTGTKLMTALYPGSSEKSTVENSRPSQYCWYLGLGRTRSWARSEVKALRTSRVKLMVPLSWWLI